jgi:hypothetical protein
MARTVPAGKRISRPGLTRALGLMAFLPLASRAPSYTRLLWALVRDERTPRSRKALLAGALGYLVAHPPAHQRADRLVGLRRPWLAHEVGERA